MVLDLIGERKRVLDIGCGSGTLAEMLAARECDIVGIDRDPLSIEEARRFCTHAFVADVDNIPVAQIVGTRTFDAVVLGELVGYLREPLRVLDECRGMLAEDGFLVASVSNGTHGSLRLALSSGAFPDPFERARVRLFSAKSVEELFLHAGFRIDRMERASAPVDLSDATVEMREEIAADPEGETLAFVIRATPLSNEAKYRAISKRLLVIGGELAAANQLIAQRDRENASLRAERAGDRGERRRQLVDGLRLALDQAIAQHDLMAGELADVARKLVNMTANRDEHIANGAEALRQFRAARERAEALQLERDEVANRGGEISRELERTRAEVEAAKTARDHAIADRSAIDALETQLEAYATRVGVLQDAALADHATIESLGQAAAAAETAAADRELATEAAHAAAVADMRRANAGLEVEVFEAWSEMERYQRERDDVLGALARVAEQYEVERETTHRLEDALKAREADVAALDAEAVAREATLLDDLETLRVLAVEHEYEIAHLKVVLSERAREAALVVEELEVAQNRLIAQADALSEATEAECQRLASLIDTVQDGPYWSVKRRLDRFWSAFRR
jgi:hypothetical protein